MAERIAFVTEDLAKCTNETVGGLMNATMGNITELIVSIVALKAGKLRLVQLSLVGSIFSNLLLVLGCAFLAGGIRYSSMRFNRSAANANSGILLLAVMALMLPSILDNSKDPGNRGGHHGHWLSYADQNPGVLHLSHGTGVVMLLVYGALIVYQLKTHRHLFEGNSESGGSPHLPARQPERCAERR